MQSVLSRAHSILVGFLGKVYCKVCCGDTTKWDIIFITSIPTIKHTVLNDDVLLVIIIYHM